MVLVKCVFVVFGGIRVLNFVPEAGCDGADYVEGNFGGSEASAVGCGGCGGVVGGEIEGCSVFEVGGEGGKEEGVREIGGVGRIRFGAEAEIMKDC